MEQARESLARDYYTILGVPKTATFEELRLAFRRKALQLHPDRLRTEDAARQFIELHDAYRYLSDPARRARYDRLFYDLDRAAAEKSKGRTDSTSSTPGLKRRKSEVNMSSPNRDERPRRKSTEKPAARPAEEPPARPTPEAPARPTQEPPARPIEEPPARSSQRDHHVPQSPRPPEYPDIQPYANYNQQASIPAATANTRPEIAGAPSMSPRNVPPPMSPRNVPLPPSPMERIEGLPEERPTREPTTQLRHGRSSSAAPPPKREWRTPSPPHMPGDTDASSIPRAQHIPPPRSHSRPRPATPKEDYNIPSDTDVSMPVYFKPLKPYQPPKPVSKPASWAYPLRLTLAELYSGCKKRFSVTRSLLNGKTEEGFIDIDVQPGWKKGTRVVYRGAGSEVEPGVFADLVFVVRQLPDANFTREGVGGQDLVARFGLKLVDALTAGGSHMIRIQTLDGRMLDVRLPEGIIRDGDMTILEGEGMPIRQNGEIIGRGDLIIEWTIIYPDTLTPEQAAALRPILSADIT